MQRIDAATAAGLVRQGARFVDIRDRDEFAREHIPGACHRPLAQLDALPGEASGARVVIFHCRSGVRTAGNADTLGKLAGDGCSAYLLDGGIDAWKRAGFAVERDVAQPLELHRQVQIAAGSLVLLGAILGFTVAPIWHGLSAAIGAGLVFAGVSGFCALARVLVLLPWNRSLRA